MDATRLHLGSEEEIRWTRSRPVEGRGESIGVELRSLSLVISEWNRDLPCLHTQLIQMLPHGISHSSNKTSDA